MVDPQMKPVIPARETREEQFRRVTSGPLTPEDFTPQGHWSPDDRTSVSMWKHKMTGLVFFADHPMTRERKLPIISFHEGAVNVRTGDQGCGVHPTVDDRPGKSPAVSG